MKFILIITLLVCALLNSAYGSPCPEPSIISPCTCSYITIVQIPYDQVTIDCSGVTTEQEFRNIFSNPFPLEEMMEFTMDQENVESSITYLDSGAFGTKRFNQMTFYNINFEVNLANFDHMSTSLQTLHFWNAPFYKFEYNFNAFTKFVILHLHECPITEFRITSPTIEVLYIHFTALEESRENEHYYLGPMENLEVLGITYNNLKEMPDTSGYQKLRSYNANGNQISNIGTTLHMTNYLDDFSAVQNGIQDIAVDSIKLSEGGILTMYENQLTELEEAKWMNVFVNAASIDLHSNPFACSCEMTWIFGSDSKGVDFLSKLSGTEACANGKLFVNLDESTYPQC